MVSLIKSNQTVLFVDQMSLSSNKMHQLLLQSFLLKMNQNFGIFQENFDSQTIGKQKIVSLAGRSLIENINSFDFKTFMQI